MLPQICFNPVGRYLNVWIMSPSNSSRRPTLDVIYFTVPHHLFHQQKIGRLLWFWWKSGPNTPIFPTFQGKATNFPLPMEKVHYCVSVTTTTTIGQPSTTPPPHIHTPLQKCCGNSVTAFLHVTTGELLPTFCKWSSTLFSTEKAGNEVREFEMSQSFMGW